MASLIILLVLVLGVGIIRGQSALIMLASLLIVSAVGFSWWSRLATTGLRYRRYFDPPRIFPGEPSDYVVEITNQKTLPLPWVRIEERLPSSFVPMRRQGPATRREPGGDGWRSRRTIALGWHERLELRHPFTCSQRGDYRAGPTNIETGDPLALFPVHMQVPESRGLLVYPRMAALEPLAAESRAPFGTVNARPPALEDPARFAGIRDYQPGDPRRWVDWKASARRMKLQTRVFAPTTWSTRIVALNVQTMAFTWQGYDAERLEAAIGIAATLVRDSILAGHLVGLAANSSGAEMEEFQVYLRPNRRPSQLEDALAALAKLSPIPTMGFGAMLRRIAANYPYGASLLAVTSYLDEDMLGDLSAMAHRQHAVSLVLVGIPPPVDLDPRIQTIFLDEVAFEDGSPDRNGSLVLGVGAPLEEG